MSPTFSWILILSLAWACHAWVNRMHIRSLQDEIEKLQPPF
jgi:hypothetical protein